MLRMVIPRVWALFSVICHKVLLFFSGLNILLTMLQILIGRVWALLSPISPKSLLFFASNFNVGFLKSTNGER